jgi:hypothetical protein
VDITLRGSREALNRAAGEEVFAYVELSGVGAGEYSLPVHAELAQDAGVVRIEPSSVKVRITSGKR